MLIKTSLTFCFLIICHSVFADNFFQFKSNEAQKINILKSGIVALDQRIKLIQEARLYIHLEYYEFNTDTAGTLILQELIKKADEGVQVQLIVDAFLSKMQVTPELAFLLKSHNIEVKYYNDTPVINPFYQHRDHRKIFIIDGEKVILGGRNIGDSYFEIDSNYNFYDRDLEIEGTFASKVDQSFKAMWNSKIVTDALNKNDLYRTNEMNKAKKIISLNSTLEEFRMILSAKASDINSNGVEDFSCHQMSFYSEFPLEIKNRKERVIKKILAQKMKNSNKEVFIESPYFIIDREMRQVFKDVESNNIDIKVVTNSLKSNNQIAVVDAFMDTVKYWIKHGMNIFAVDGYSFENYPKMNEDSSNITFGTHAKTYLFDQKEAFVGSYNFDPRSENINVELLVGCEDSKEFASEIREDLIYRSENSLHLDNAKNLEKMLFIGISKSKKIISRLMRFPAMVLLPYL
jgi:putative cardiolipin synthase